MRARSHWHWGRHEAVRPGPTQGGGRAVSGAPSPFLTVGMPTFNSAATIRSAIDSLLAQRFGDFELVISDNASTDDTWAIVQEYTQRDPRVRAMRQARNIGANANYSAVFDRARGRYFKWASSNDWCAPDFLAQCVERLERDPELVLVAPRTRLFQSDLAQATNYSGDIACMQASPAERFIHAGTKLALNNVMNGVVRLDALRQTRLIEHYPGADTVLVGHLALLGKISLLDDRLFYRRMDAATATRMMSEAAVMRHHYPDDTWRSRLPSWRLALGWLRVALTAPVPGSEKRRALGWVLRMTYWKRAHMARDLRDLLR
jgi:glycosyltransferase involved in cell wall biosynthesis